MCEPGEERQKEKYCQENFYLLPLCFPSRLEAQAQPQTDGPAIVNTLVRVALNELPEIRVGFDVGNRKQFPGNRIHVQEKHPEVRKVKRCVRISRRTQWMVKDVVEICAHFEAGAFSKVEFLSQTEVSAPGAWPRKRVAPNNIGIIEQVCPDGGHTEGRRVEEGAAWSSIRAGISDTERPIGKVISKTPDCVEGIAGYVAGENRIAVSTLPEWRKTCAALGKHVPGKLPTTKSAFKHWRGVSAILASLSEWQLDGAITDKPVTGNECIAGEIIFGMKLVIGRPTQTRIGSVEAAALLVQQRVAGVESKAACEAPVDLNLHRMRATGAEVAVAEQERTEFRERQPRSVSI